MQSFHSPLERSRSSEKIRDGKELSSIHIRAKDRLASRSQLEMCVRSNFASRDGGRTNDGRSYVDDGKTGKLETRIAAMPERDASGCLKHTFSFSSSSCGPLASPTSSFFLPFPVAVFYFPASEPFIYRSLPPLRSAPRLPPRPPFLSFSKMQAIPGLKLPIYSPAITISSATDPLQRGSFQFVRQGVWRSTVVSSFYISVSTRRKVWLGSGAGFFFLSPFSPLLWMGEIRRQRRMVFYSSSCGLPHPWQKQLQAQLNRFPRGPGVRESPDICHVSFFVGSGVKFKSNKTPAVASLLLLLLLLAALVPSRERYMGCM